jgi:hypothetical protein
MRVWALWYIISLSSRHVLRVEWEWTCGHSDRKEWPGIKLGQMGLASPRDSSTEFRRESRSKQEARGEKRAETDGNKKRNGYE